MIIEVDIVLLVFAIVWVCLGCCIWIPSFPWLNYNTLISHISGDQESETKGLAELCRVRPDSWVQMLVLSPWDRENILSKTAILTYFPLKKAQC